MSSAVEMNGNPDRNYSQQYKIAKESQDLPNNVSTALNTEYFGFHPLRDIGKLFDVLGKGNCDVYTSNKDGKKVSILIPNKIEAPEKKGTKVNDIRY